MISQPCWCIPTAPSHADPHNAVHNAVVLEELAFMAFHTEAIASGKGSMQQELLDKHYLRKHGKNAYYGQ